MTCLTVLRSYEVNLNILFNLGLQYYEVLLLFHPHP